MSEPFVFDPRHHMCKTPFGAVECGQSVTFKCRPLQSENFVRCDIVLHQEFADTVRQIELHPEGEAGDRFCYSVTLQAPAEGDLVWYHFRFHRADGTGAILDKTGYRNDSNIVPWQLTVYEKDRSCPWFGAGLTYQIFPDRFYRTNIPDPTGMVGDRVVHENWNDAPVWKPDAKGIVRNNDFFGGSLEGIIEKLDYLKSLNVSTLYLCPIFEAASNHRYNTADYTKVDPMLGTEEDFSRLCALAKQKGIRVILDGVFNHTGSQSVYFNEDGFYPSVGAAQSKKSPYYEWFRFKKWPTDYESWWGIKTLPAVEEDCQDYVDFIIRDEDSVVKHWLRAGASGWRLDVADELPDRFIAQLRQAADEVSGDSLLLGEVWEDGTTKIAYDERRRYLLGGEFHGLMNYPFRTSLIDYLLQKQSYIFFDAMETIRENYPPAHFYASMNFLGTHDTARILTVLGASEPPKEKADRAEYVLSDSERKLGMARLRMASLILYTFPGSPTVYYGDEAGLEGFEDPFNRKPYPWGNEDTDLLHWYTKLGKIRKRHPALRRGELQWLTVDGPVLAYRRTDPTEHLVVVTNAADTPQQLTIPWEPLRAYDLLSRKKFFSWDGQLTITIPAHGCFLLI